MIIFLPAKNIQVWPVSAISYIILALYLVLLLTAEGMGLLAVAAGGLKPIPDSAERTWLWVCVAGIGTWALGFGVIIPAYCRSKHKPDPQPVIAGVLLPLFTVVLGIVLLICAVADPLDAWHWIVTAGMYLAIYIQFYWVYSAWKSGLYRQKPGRRWPEGPGKDPAP